MDPKLEALVIDRESAKLSGVLKEYMEKYPKIKDDDLLYLWGTVQKSILKIVFQWMDYHKNDPTLNQLPKFFEGNMIASHTTKKHIKMSAWDNKFFKNNEPKLVHIMIAAKELEVYGLYYMTAQRIALLLLKPSNQVRNKHMYQNPAVRPVRHLCMPHTTIRALMEF